MRIQLIRLSVAFAGIGLAAQPAAAVTYKIIHSFAAGSDGAYPLAGLIKAGGMLYGTTTLGGAYDYGTVFKVDPGTGAESVVYSFRGSCCGDGQYPQASLIEAGGTLYGTTPSAEGSYGTVFRVDPATGAESVVYTFTDGSSPVASLLKVGGELYGTTAYGSAFTYGTVFKVKPSTGAESVLYSFRGGSDGSNPSANVIDVGGRLFGTTFSGGSTGFFSFGTVFEINPKTGAETVVHAFSGADGSGPYAGLINVGGALYGTTYYGGIPNSDGYGTVFKVDPAVGAERVVYAFTGGSDGNGPYGGLVDVGGMLYGTTVQGGASINGTVFMVDPSTGMENVLHSFGGSGDGAGPYAGLIEVGGMLYGTTNSGGAIGSGTVFAVKP